MEKVKQNVMRLLRASCVFLAVMMGGFCSGCAQPAPVGDAVGPSVSPVKGEPTFTGPYADILLNDYRAAPAGFAREVLQDGLVTELERSEGKELFARCLQGIGVTLESYDDATGGYSIKSETQQIWDNFQDRQSKAAQSCYMDTGLRWIDAIFLDMRANPQNEDHLKLTYECLLALEAVPTGYSLADFTREYTEGGPIALRDSAREHDPQGPLLQCENDPLGLVKHSINR